MNSEIFTVTFFTTFLASSVRMAIPFVYAAIGENISEKAGIINVVLKHLCYQVRFWFSCSIFNR